MADAINYGFVDHRKTVSRFGIASFVGGIVGMIYLFCLWKHGNWDATSDLMRLILDIPLIGIPSLAIAFGIAALVRRRRFWWLAFFGLPLSLIPLGLLELQYIAFRYFS